MALVVELRLFKLPYILSLILWHNCNLAISSDLNPRKVKVAWTIFCKIFLKGFWNELFSDISETQWSRFFPLRQQKLVSQKSKGNDDHFFLLGFNGRIPEVGGWGSSSNRPKFWSYRQVNATELKFSSGFSLILVTRPFSLELIFELGSILIRLSKLRAKWSGLALTWQDPAIIEQRPKGVSCMPL